MNDKVCCPVCGKEFRDELIERARKDKKNLICLSWTGSPHWEGTPDELLTWDEDYAWVE